VFPYKNCRHFVVLVTIFYLERKHLDNLPAIWIKSYKEYIRKIRAQQTKEVREDEMKL
jgi:hypothetical protein